MENINEVDEPGLPLAENEQPSFADLDFVVVGKKECVSLLLPELINN